MGRQGRALMLVFLLLAAMTAGSIRAQDEYEYIADSGFRPADNGFSFQNYTDGYTNLTSIEMERLFGDLVCESEERDEDGGCYLTPTAEMWMEDRNERILGGHCEGMAALSLLMYGEMEDPEWFGGEAIYELSLDESEDLQREIALMWATWGSQPSVAYFDVPSVIVDTLAAALSDNSEAYTLNLYMPDWTKGHAVTPYAIADQGDGIVWIMLYDNNWPGEERYVEVDLNAETWWYSASTNPEAMEFLYQGDSTTQTLGLVPVSGRLDIHECPFCGDATSEDTNYTGIVVSGNGAQSTVTDSSGNTIGLVDGKFVNNIPGAKVQHPVNGLLFSQQPALIFVPAGVKFRVALSAGDPAIKNSRASVSFIRSGVVSRVSNINLDDHEDFVDLDGYSLSYTSGNGGETPTIEQGMTTSGNDYHYEITGKSDMSEAGTLNFSFDPQTGEFNIGGSDDNEYSINVDRIDADGNIENFHTDGLVVPAGENTNLDAGEWEEGSDITGELTDLDGDPEESIDSTDEAPEVDPTDDPSDGSSEETPPNDESGEAIDTDPANDDTSGSQTETDSEEPANDQSESDG